MIASSASTEGQELTIRFRLNTHTSVEQFGNRQKLTGAVEFDRWKTQLFGNVSVLDRQSFVHLEKQKQNIKAKFSGTTETVPVHDKTRAEQSK